MAVNRSILKLQKFSKERKKSWKKNSVCVCFLHICSQLNLFWVIVKNAILSLKLHQKNFMPEGLSFKKSIALLKIIQKRFNWEQKWKKQTHSENFFHDFIFFKNFCCFKIARFTVFWAQNTNGRGTLNFWATSFQFSKFT